MFQSQYVPSVAEMYGQLCLFVEWIYMSLPAVVLYIERLSNV